ncbi:hypothetical protein FS842_003384 [Serendipita sp. 407]|nr:hypothetical protein FS842_003384 [Serendipita sp. 407]
MEAKLKAMKVADLKAVLQQANVAFDSKLTKPALIKKIMETPEASSIVSTDGNGADDDLPDLPPNINWDEPKGASDATPVALNPVSTSAPAPAASSAAAGSSSATSSTAKPSTDSVFKAEDLPTLTLEDEAARRKARAAKWGTTYIEPKVAGTSKSETKATATTSTLPADVRQFELSRESN